MRLIAILILGCMVWGCASQTATPTPSAAAPVRTDIDGLAAFVSLPFQPTSVQWTATTLTAQPDRSVPGPTDTQLEAVLSFAAADLEQLRTQAQPLSWKPQWKESTFKPWYPQSVRAAFAFDGDAFQLTVPSYDAIPVFGSTRPGSFFITPAGDVLLSISTN
ncbi:hypothetical protein [Herpetosiphon giganteus]|uniref:hypothetical protein n=1 Tax=Herpetosiphon giganteus TaxID=2029754 RepID=UPI00195F03C0|nr:hypothetical protein [Herpetosiphon giganteus]MBM7843860.1 hypothetical protein [Herpetosiphon giganteus]